MNPRHLTLAFVVCDSEYTCVLALEKSMWPSLIQWIGHQMKKINKERLALNDTLLQWTQQIYITFHPKAAEYTFFSSAHRTFSRIDHILGHKLSLSKFKKIEIISSIFSDHNTMILEMNYPDTKTRQRQYKVRKLQTSITDEYRCKNPQQNTSKQNPKTH